MAEQENALILDMVNGRIGTIVDKKPNGDRIDIQFMPLGKLFGKEWILNIPTGGLKQIDMSKLRTPYDWYLLINDGSNKSSPILEALNIHMTTSITAAEETTKKSGLRDSVASTREKLADTQSTDKIKEFLEMMNIGKKRRDISIPIDISEEGV